MILFPAIDLKDGHCVRLRQGEMAEATVFNTDPAAQARSFEEQGFDWLHVVDLERRVRRPPRQRQGGRGDLRCRAYLDPARRRHPRSRYDRGLARAGRRSRRSRHGGGAEPGSREGGRARFPRLHRRRHRCARRQGRDRRLGRDERDDRARSCPAVRGCRGRGHRPHRHCPRRRARGAQPRLPRPRSRAPSPFP